MTVADYVAKFPELSRCALHIIGTKREKARKFQEGLAPYIHNKMVPLMIIDYAEAFEREMLVVPDHQQDLRHRRNSERRLHNNNNRGNHCRNAINVAGHILGNAKQVMSVERLTI